MDEEQALNTIWDYMHMNHTLVPADVIFALGSSDTRVAEYVADLWLDKMAPVILFSGSGSIHNHRPDRAKFVGSSEAEVFMDVAVSKGVPKTSILVENKSQNTGENYHFSMKLLKANGYQVQSVIAVQKPYMERRTYATGKIWWPEVDLMVTSPLLTLASYPNEEYVAGDEWIHVMVGDLQRIMEYPAHGFQIEQVVPAEVQLAYQTLCSLGYTNKMIPHHLRTSDVRK